MSTPRINYMAIVACVVFQTFFGMFWYSPWGLGDFWLSLTGLTMDDLEAMGVRPHVVSIVASFVTTYTLAWLIIATQSFNTKGGLKIGLIVWVGILTPTMWALNTFKGYGFALSALESGSELVNFAVTGAVLAGWRRRS